MHLVTLSVHVHLGKRQNMMYMMILLKIFFVNWTISTIGQQCTQSMISQAVHGQIFASVGIQWLLRPYMVKCFASVGTNCNMFSHNPVLGKSYGPILITAFPHCIAMFSHNSRVGLKLWTNLIYRGRLIHILYFVLFLFNLFILGSRDIFSVGRTRVKAASLPRYPTWRANNFPIFNRLASCKVTIKCEREQIKHE